MAQSGSQAISGPRPESPAVHGWDAAAPTLKGRDLQQLKRWYAQMCLFRRFEEQANQAYMKQKFAGFLHLHIGQEGLAVGVQEALRPTDYMISGYRSHTQAIGKGIEPKQVMAELFGKATGCSQGKGGSMHMFSAEHRFMGGHGIVGGQAPLAAGIGFAIRYRREDHVCVCYVGDAAMNQGQVLESLNMVTTWNLPVIYIIENNKYGMGTDIARTTSVDHLYKRALGFDMEHGVVDGMDVLAVYDHMVEAIGRIREQPHAYLLEAKTYRYRGHSISDPASYRSKDEVEHYRGLDPIKRLGKQLTEAGVDADALKGLDDDAKAAVKEAFQYAEDSPEPDMASIWKDILAP